MVNLPRLRVCLEAIDGEVQAWEWSCGADAGAHAARGTWRSVWAGSDAGPSGTPLSSF